MMPAPHVRFPYGNTFEEAVLTDCDILGELNVAEAGTPLTDARILEALRNPVGMEHDLARTVAPDDTVAIIVPDSFRAAATDRVIPHVLAELNRVGISDDAISIVFATGTHRPPTEDEQRTILGSDIFLRMRNRLVSHDPDDTAGLVDFGTTSRGTPVRINRRVAESRKRILIGAVVFHYFAGYGGGRKLLLPGVAARESIAHNHAMTLDPAEDRINPAVRIGRMPGNPVAEDMLEAARMVGADYCINSVLDRTGGIAGLYCGHMEHAHAAGVEHARRMFAAHIPQQADLVIANAGNVRNFVQSHKALYNAWQAMKPNGRIVLATRCEEGLGTARFIEWVRMADRATIIRELRKRGEINGQTALSTREKAPSALFVTELGEDEVGALGGRKVSCLQAGVDQAFAELRERGVSRPTCWIMPSAAYTVPFVGQMEMSALQ